jgi:hypothetical protein
MVYRRGQLDWSLERIVVANDRLRQINKTLAQPKRVVRG